MAVFTTWHRADYTTQCHSMSASILRSSHSLMHCAYWAISTVSNSAMRGESPKAVGECRGGVGGSVALITSGPITQPGGGCNWCLVHISFTSCSANFNKDGIVLLWLWWHCSVGRNWLVWTDKTRFVQSTSTNTSDSDWIIGLVTFLVALWKVNLYKELFLTSSVFRLYCSAVMAYILLLVLSTESYTTGCG